VQTAQSPLKSFVFSSIRKCLQVLNLKDLKSFIVYEFRGDRESGGFAGDKGCGDTSWGLGVTAPAWHDIATLSNITYVEFISNGGNYFERGGSADRRWEHPAHRLRRVGHPAPRENRE